MAQFTDDGTDREVQLDSILGAFYDAVAASDRFGPVTVRHHAWHESYDAERYVQLLSTYSDHRRLALRTRAELLDGIRTLIDRDYGGRIVKSYVAVLYLARVISAADETSR